MIKQEIYLVVKKRVMIAKALVHEPKLLILDEPTAGVDIELRREMWDFLSDINKKDYYNFNNTLFRGSRAALQ